MFPSIAVDRQNGNLYAAWIDARFSNFQYNSIAYSMSTDGGFTWSTPIQVNQTPNSVPAIDRQAFNPTIAVAADGTLGVSYYDFRNNTAAPGALTDYWLAYAPAPATNPSAWGEVRLTDNSFDLGQVPTRFGGDSWLGDYEGLAAAGNDFVAAWAMPNGSATAQESVFFRRAISVTGSPLLAAAAPTPSNAVVDSLTLPRAQPLLAEAISRWAGTGADTSALAGVQIIITNLPGAELGEAIGNTVYLDSNAAGWGWFVDNSPRTDSEFRRAGNQGEQGRMDLLSVLMHEVGHVLGHDHADTGVMSETLSAGERLGLSGVNVGNPFVFLAPANAGDPLDPLVGYDRSGRLHAAVKLWMK